MGGHKDDSILSLGASYRSPLQDASSLVDLDNLWGRHFNYGCHLTLIMMKKILIISLALFSYANMAFSESTPFNLKEAKTKFILKGSESTLFLNISCLATKKSYAAPANANKIFDGKTAFESIEVVTNTNSSCDNKNQTSVFKNYYDEQINYIGTLTDGQAGFFNGKPYKISPSYHVVTSYKLPDIVSPHDSGLAYSYNIYADESKSKIITTYICNYSTEENTSNSIFYTESCSAYAGGGSEKGFTTLTKYMLTGDNNLTKLSITGIDSKDKMVYFYKKP